MEAVISKKAFLEHDLEICQKQIWDYEIAIRNLERQKLKVGVNGLLQTEDTIRQLKSLIESLKARIEVLQDEYREFTGERIIIKFE